MAARLYTELAAVGYPRRSVDYDIDWKAEGDRCIALLQDLIRIPTVNRGDEGCNERPAAERVADFLRDAKLDPICSSPKKIERASSCAFAEPAQSRRFS